ncbi:MAG: hypothetical protein GXP33_05640 [Spirochaetes bacterium]|nr:hypothetical protein [Spirochaetota bacterium]
MEELIYDYSNLSTRDGFNKSLRHFKEVMSIIGDLENNENLSDILLPLLENKELSPEQLSPIVHSLLADKYGYFYKSYNMEKSISDFNLIAEETSGWSKIDLTLVYFHPELGLLPINPKRIEHWEAVRELKKNELVVIYSGHFKDTGKNKIYSEAIELMIQLIKGKKIKTPSSFIMKTGTGKVEVVSVKRDVPEKQAPSAKEKITAKAGGKKRMTPMYSIPVTNELFHNGNVEAWKKIIQSYRTKHPDLDVYIFYEGERIHDINTLFKWGKVKHGSAILISVAGEDIKDVAKLQRYLKQGASPMFEAFLRFPVNTILNLF